MGPLRAEPPTGHERAIGVDTDQYLDISDERDHLLTSMYKRFDLGIEAVIAAHVAGELTGAGSITLDLADGAVGYTATGGHLRPETIDALESFRAEILDGTTVVDPTPSELPPPQRPFVLNLATGGHTPLPDGLIGGIDYWVSPDGKRIAYVDGSSIRIVDVATGESTVVADGLTVEWLGDDRLVIVPG